jgi:ribose transport system permease protein
MSQTNALKKKFRKPAFSSIAITTILLFVGCALFVPNSLSQISIEGMLPFASILAIASIGQTLVIQQRGIDLSAAGVISIAAMAFGVMYSRWGFDPYVAAAICLIGSIVIGAINGLLVAWLNVTPLVATLAMNSILFGFVQVITGGAPAQTPEALSTFVQGSFFGIPMLLVIATVSVLIMALLASKTVLGRKFIAAGANPDAAKIGGVRTKPVLVLAYVTASFTYGFAGMLLAAYLQNVGVQVGNDYMLAVIATVIVGGTPLAGGKGTIIGSAIASIFMSQLVQMVLTMGGPTSVQLLVQAITIAIAATVQGFTGRIKRKQAPTVIPNQIDKTDTELISIHPIP